MHLQLSYEGRYMRFVTESAEIETEKVTVGPLQRSLDQRIRLCFRTEHRMCSPLLT